MCRLLDCLVCRLLDRSVCRLLDRSVCLLLDCSTCRLLDRSVCRLLDRSGQVSLHRLFCRLPLTSLGASLCLFLDLASSAGRLLDPFCSFSPFFRIPPGSRPSCGSLILGLFIRLALEGSGHRHRVYFRHPQGPFGYWKQGNTYHRLTEVSSVYMLIEAWNSSIYRGHGVSLWYGFLHEPQVHAPPVPFCSPAFQVTTLRQYTHFITLDYWIIIALKCTETNSAWIKT